MLCCIAKKTYALGEIGREETCPFQLVPASVLSALIVPLAAPRVKIAPLDQPPLHIFPATNLQPRFKCSCRIATRQSCIGELPPISALGCPRESFCSSKDTGRPQWDPFHSLEVYFLAYGNVVGFAVCSVLLVKNSFHGHFFASKTNPYSTSRIIQFVNGDFFFYASSCNFGFSVVKTNEIEF